VENSSGADGGSMEFTAGSSSSGVGGWRGLFHRRVVKLGSWWISHLGIRRSIAMNGGSGANSMGGSVTIESGVGTEATGIRVRLVFRPPMQVFPESVVACH
jgi:hypothetical protein